MITLITGVPGSGKSLHAVSDLLLPMQTAEIEHDGVKVKRTLYTNIKNLLLDHVLIDKDNLLNWHTWVKAGDLICFDEVQEVWRPRGMSAATPDSIAKLETHRHMGVDFIIVTQHPMLLDQNIRRLVGRHLHVRRIANMALAVVYEWDHASNPSSVKSAITTRAWRYPKSVYKLYKSADAHTKQPRRLPFALIVLMVAFVGLVYGAWSMKDRMSERYGGKLPVVVSTTTTSTVNAPAGPSVSVGSAGAVDLGRTVLAGPAVAGQADVFDTLSQRPLGCIASAARCSCFGEDGYKVPMSEKACRTASTELVYIIREKVGGSDKPKQVISEPLSEQDAAVKKKEVSSDT